MYDGLTWNDFGGYYEGDAWAARGDAIERKEAAEEREHAAMERTAKLYTEMAGLYPFGNEYAMFQLAWVKFKLGKTAELPGILAHCKGFSSDAKYLTMQGAEALSRGRYRKAHALLAKSLKLDKGINETHSLLADYYRRKGDNAAADVHLRWLRRST